MPNESQIDRIEQQLDDMARLGGKSERTAIFTNVVVIDANPAGLANRIIIQDPRDGNYVPALQSPGVQYANNDLVNVLFVEGTEPLAFQQGSGSSGSNVKVFEIWESDFGAVAWQTGATGNLANVDGETLTLNDSTPTTRILLDPATPATSSDMTLYDETGLTRIQMASGLNAGDASITLDDGGGADKVIISSNGNILISDDLVHLGDTDTLLSFTDDLIELQAGGIVLLRLTETVQDLVEIGNVAGTGDVDVNINAGQMTVLGSHGNVAIGVTPDTVNRLYVYRDTTSVARVRIENPNTGTGAFADIYILASKAAGGVHGYAIEMFGHNYTATWSGITLGNYAFFRSDATVSGLIYTTGGNAPLIFGTSDVERMRISGNATQVAIGTNSPAVSAILDLTSTTGALLLPRMTTTQRNALTAVNGMILFNTTTGVIEGYEGGWVNL